MNDLDPKVGFELFDVPPTAHTDEMQSQIAFEADPDLLTECLEEIEEHLRDSESIILQLEQSPSSSDLIEGLFRAFHSIKGISSFLALADMQQLAHQSETMLGSARDAAQAVTPKTIDLVLNCIDGLGRQVSCARQWLDEHGVLPRDPGLPRLLESLADFIGTTDVSKSDACDPSPNPNLPADSALFSSSDGSDCDTAIQFSSVAQTASIKVSPGKLDQFVNLSGELAIAFGGIERQVHDRGLENECLSLQKVVHDLQELSLSLRMVPIATVFRKMGRVVHDLSRSLGKEIRLNVEGDATELDRALVERIGDPMLHMIRNAADHGLESPQERLDAGKPETGVILLRAYHEGGYICIEIKDDGRGLDPQKLTDQAIAAGLIAADEKLSNTEAFDLIFTPGFSTASQVTDISGRGVGMDVVHSTIAGMQGSISVSSKLNEGTSLLIRLPLTLAIMDGLCVEVAGEIYVLPILSVVESLRPRSSDLLRIGSMRALKVRDEIVPLVNVKKLLNTQRIGRQDRETIDLDVAIVVIIEDRGRQYGLMVDELIGQSQVVIKNLENNYKRVPGIAGATILGNGQLGMIIDTFGLLGLAGRSNEFNTLDEFTAQNT